MLSFKGIFKSLAYLVIAGWMFFLGILVGRGSAPVTFDTHRFQQRLEIIAQEFGKSVTPQGEINLEFYDALTQPVQPEVMEAPAESVQPVEIKKPVEMEIPNTPPKVAGQEDILPSPEPVAPVEPVPVKTSRKAATRNRAAIAQVLAKSAPAVPAAPGDKKPQSVAPEGVTKPELPPTGNKAESGQYTIQIAAYSSFMDTITHMAQLEDKGFSSYRVMNKKNEVTWYRIRIGSFETHEQAARFVEQLNKAKIKGMIIKKE